MKKLIATILITIFLMATAEADEYFRFGNVIDIEYDTDCVTVDDGLGNLWEFFGCDWYFYGDLVLLTMDDSNTPDWIYDDRVIKAEPCTAEQAEELIKTIRNNFSKS